MQITPTPSTLSFGGSTAYQSTLTVHGKNLYITAHGLTKSIKTTVLYTIGISAAICIGGYFMLAQSNPGFAGQLIVYTIVGGIFAIGSALLGKEEKIEFQADKRRIRTYNTLDISVEDLYFDKIKEIRKTFVSSGIQYQFKAKTKVPSLIFGRSEQAQEEQFLAFLDRNELMHLIQ